MGFPCGLASKESACNVEDLGSILGLGRSPGEEKGYPLQKSGLENSIVHGVAKSQTQLNDFHFTSMELYAMILVFWMLSFKPPFSLSSFTLIKRLFSFSSFSALEEFFKVSDKGFTKWFFEDNSKSIQLDRISLNSESVLCFYLISRMELKALSNHLPLMVFSFLLEDLIRSDSKEHKDLLVIPARQQLEEMIS